MARFPHAIAWCLAASVLLAAAAPAQAWPFRHRHRGFWPIWPYSPYGTYLYHGGPREDLWCLEQRYLETRSRERREGNQTPADAKRLTTECKQKQETFGR